MYRKILIASDLTDASRRAVEVAAKLAQHRGAQRGALHVVDQGLEGTVHGSAMLARWTEQRPAAPALRVAEAGYLAPRLRAAQADWLARLQTVVA